MSDAPLSESSSDIRWALAHFAASAQRIERARQMEDTMVGYHPDPEINAEIIAQALIAEKADLAAGYPPRWWRCDCGASHNRGHFQVIGVHRCMACGYVGEGGTTHTNRPVPEAA